LPWLPLFSIAAETLGYFQDGKRFSFSQPVQVLNVNQEAGEVNFIADSEKRSRNLQ
jgi:hypothetical protein